MSDLNHNNTTPQAAAPEPSSTVSDARLAANRENAQKSTGATVLFTNADDARKYARHAADYQQLLQPVGPEECALVQSMLAEQAPTGRPETISDIRWRLATIPVLELGIIAMGNAEIIDANPDRWSKPENQTFLNLEARRRHEKELRNLALQENRLARHRDPNAMHSAIRIPGLGFDFSIERLQSYIQRLKPAQRAILLQEALAEAAEALQSMEAAA